MDISGISTISGSLDISGNLFKTSVNMSGLGALTDLIVTNSIFSAGTLIDLSDSVPVVDNVNKILYNMSQTNIFNCTIDISGTNPAPDATSGGFDGLAAVVALESNGNTIITS
jgi:hypothetical protein